MKLANYQDIWFPIANQNQVDDKWFVGQKTKLTLDGKCNWFENIPQANDNIDQSVINSTKINLDEIQFILEPCANHNPELLQQYYDLRHSEFQKKYGSKYNGAENDFDRKNKIILIQYQGKTVGGARISFAEKGKLLPQEIPKQDYNYKSICKKANIDGVVLTDNNYVEVRCVCIAPTFRNYHLLEEMYKYLMSTFKENKIQYVFGVAKLKNNLENKIASSSIGYKSVLLKNFIAPKTAEYNFSERFPIIIFI